MCSSRVTKSVVIDMTLQIYKNRKSMPSGIFLIYFFQGLAVLYSLEGMRFIPLNPADRAIMKLQENVHSRL